MVRGIAGIRRISSTALVCALLLASSTALPQNLSDPPAGKSTQSSLSADMPKSQETQGKEQDTPAATRTQNERAGDDQKPDNGVKGKLHFRLGTITAGASYVHLPGSFLYDYPFYAPFYPYDLYPYGLAPSPLFYAPIYAPFYGPYTSGLTYDIGKGQVKLVAEPKTAEVYLDGAYAGLAASLKSLWLQPGAYDLTVATPDGREFHQRIYVLSGKTVKIRATLLPQNVQGKTKDTREKQL